MVNEATGGFLATKLLGKIKKNIFFNFASLKKVFLKNCGTFCGKKTLRFLGSF
jgi:hypothetical protein